MKLKQFILAGVAGLVAAQPALAHRMWMLPSTFTLSGDEQWITVDGAISNDLFFPNHVPLNYENITVSSPDGAESAVEDGWVGKYRTTFDVKLDQQGTYKLTENGGTWFARWSENGEPQRRRGSIESFREDGLLDKADLNLSNSKRKVETFVTLGAPSETVFEPKNTGLELQPITHPNDVYEGEEASFAFLLDGEPASGLEIEISKGNDRYRNDAGLITVTTGEDGSFSFTPEEPGRYWLSTGTQAEGSFEGRTISVRNSYVMTIEALPF
ncbi:MAG: ABC transporter permease [Ponticaulis sp.]|nr:ABC transporter permease [Ponticaulis sp.]|tara:strand:+ start:5761 stop:6570 length:810 start_codon:yes stop_codon:yes gene_type:complete